MNNPYATPSSPMQEEDELSRKQRRDARLIRICLFLQIPMIAAYIMVKRIFQIQQSETEPSMTLQSPFFWVITILFVATLSSWVGLLFMKRWAGWLFTATYIVGLSGYLYFPQPETLHPYVLAVDCLDNFLSITIVIMVFFSYAIKPKNVAEQDVALDG